MEHTNKDTQRAYAERPDIMQAMIEGNRFRVHTIGVYAMKREDEYGFAVGDVLDPVDPPEEWERTNADITKMIVDELKTLSPKCHDAITLSMDMMELLLADSKPFLLMYLETWLSMADDGGSLWDVNTALSLPAVALPELVAIAKRSQGKAMGIVCEL